MLQIRPSIPSDAALIVSLIEELAEYEKLRHECEAAEQGISQWLFGENPKAHCLILEWSGEVAGFVLYFYNFSTFLAKPGIYVKTFLCARNSVAAASPAQHSRA